MSVGASSVDRVTDFVSRHLSLLDALATYSDDGLGTAWPKRVLPVRPRREQLLETPAGLELALAEGLQRKRLTQFAKRVADIVLAGSLFLALLPLLSVIWIVVRLTSKGPGLFVQERHGRAGAVFGIIKFRTMYSTFCDQTGVNQTVPDDPRVTPLGRLLRRYSLDELPQLWNVIKGDMSLVGPRPHPIGIKAAGLPYEELVPAYHSRHLLRPGITGLAQVMGYRGPTTDADSARSRIACDLAYVANCSVALDMKLLLLTAIFEVRHATGS